jgi:hypothetical protein
MSKTPVTQTPKPTRRITGRKGALDPANDKSF